MLNKLKSFITNNFEMIMIIFHLTYLVYLSFAIDTASGIVYVLYTIMICINLLCVFFHISMWIINREEDKIKQQENDEMYYESGKLKLHIIPFTLSMKITAIKEKVFIHYMDCVLLYNHEVKLIALKRFNHRGIIFNISSLNDINYDENKILDIIQCAENQFGKIDTLFFHVNVSGEFLNSFSKREKRYFGRQLYYFNEYEIRRNKNEKTSSSGSQI